jgi:hypothetical protein
MSFPFAPILLGSHLLIAAPEGVPNVDIQKTCQAAAGAMTELMACTTAQRDLTGCLSSEHAAREQLTKQWATYSSAERAQCVQPTVYLPSYIEWLRRRYAPPAEQVARAGSASVLQAVPAGWLASV